jgi:A/G-specific adenine glycosylase
MNKAEQLFVECVWKYYSEHGRTELPWRTNQNPYQVLVSELMLQQTQVERVIPKYEAFMQKWPTIEQLASARQSEVLIAWQGLGYNRRAKFLHQCAKVITTEYRGVFPTDTKALVQLPGIGPYTASALMAFAFNQPVILIETNVRRVYLHHFFPAQEDISDQSIFPYIERTLPKENAREWYAALMDYGTYLKKTVANPNRRSKHYVKQSTFKGSDREIRGALLRAFSHSALSKKQLQTSLSGFDVARVESQLQALIEESLVEKVGRSFRLKQ